MNFCFTCSWINGVGVQVVGKSSWKEREIGNFRWLVRNESEKNELKISDQSWEVQLELESFQLTWKEPLKLESYY